MRRNYSAGGIIIVSRQPLLSVDNRFAVSPRIWRNTAFSAAVDKNSLTPPFRDGKQEKDETFGGEATGGVTAGNRTLIRQSERLRNRKLWMRLPARGISGAPEFFFCYVIHAAERYRDRIENESRFNELAVLILHETTRGRASASCVSNARARKSMYNVGTHFWWILPFFLLHTNRISLTLYLYWITFFAVFLHDFLH